MKQLILFFLLLSLIGALGAHAADDRFITVSDNQKIRVTSTDASKMRMSASAITKSYEDKRVTIDLFETLPIINANWAQVTMGLYGTGATICVIDTGIDDTRFEFSGRIIDQACFCDDAIAEDGIGCCPNGNETDTDALDENGHGTHVTGIAAASSPAIVGVAPDADIVAVRVLDASGEGYLSDVLKGIQYCVDNANTYDINIVTMSLGTSDLYSSVCDSELQPMADIIDQGTAEGILFVASVGNEGSSTSVRMPACMANVLSVGSSSDADTMSSFTNRGPLLDLLAPGEDVLSMALGSGFSEKTGTSMSAPHVAGAAALLLDEDDSLTPAQLREGLTTSAVMIDGYPRLNLISAYYHLFPEDEVPEFGAFAAILAAVGAFAGFVFVRRK